MVIIENIEKVKKWCEENNFMHYEYTEVGIVYIENKITDGCVLKGKTVEMSMTEIMNMKEYYLEQYLKHIETELHKLD